MKYKYNGSEEVLLIEHHKIVKPEEEIEVDQPIDNPLFVLVEEKKKAKEAKEVIEEAVN